MDSQIILACDDDGKFLEYIPKEVGHTGEGRRHLAITVLLYNSKGEVLIQRRKHKVFDNIWDFTASTHPLHKEDGKDESLEEAALRALEDEYGISPTSPPLRPSYAGRARLRGVKKIGEFNYFAPYRTVRGELCENEHDNLLIGQYDGEVKLNPEKGYEYKWILKEDLLKDMEDNPQKYTPWAIEGAKILKKVLT